MSRLLRLATICSLTVAAATTARALPLTPVPNGDWTLDGALRASISPNLGPWPNWGGFHVGVNVGGAWEGNTTADFLAVPVSPTADFGAGAVLTESLSANGGGAIGGGQIGYDFQWPFGLVSGVEADFQGLSFRDNASLATPSLFSEASSLIATKRVDFLGTVRLRMGYQLTPGVMFYGTGGYAYGHVGFTINNSVVSFPLNFGAATIADYASTRTGYAVGGGIEYTITPNLIGRFEYLRYDLGIGCKQTPFVTTDSSQQWPGLAQRTEASFSGNVFRVALNYRFMPDLPAPALPVIAKY